MEKANIMKWYEIVALAFIGAMLYVWARGRNMDSIDGESGAYPSGTAPVEHDSLMLSVGFVHSVDARPRRDEIIMQPMETSNCAIPLASDYLHCAPEHAPSTSQWNLSCYCESLDTDWGIVRSRAQTNCSIGICGGVDCAVPVRIPESVCCNPDIPGTIPGTEVI